MPYAGATERMYWAPAIAPAMDALWSPLGTPFKTHELLQPPSNEFLTFPAKYAAPPCDICKMIGDFLSRAASNDATTVEEEVTF